MNRFNCLALASLAFLFPVGACSTGCASFKALDSTRAVDFATRGEQHVTYSVIPGDVAGLPDKALAIPTVPGKDVEFHAFYPDGTPQWSLETRRSDVLEAIIGAGGISAVDAAKFAADAEAREWLSRERAAWQAMIGPIIQQRLNAPPVASEPNLQSQIKALIAAELEKMTALNKPPTK